MDLWPKASALQTKGVSRGSRRKESGRVCVFIELLRELITKKQAEVIEGEGCWALISDRGREGKRWGGGRHFLARQRWSASLLHIARVEGGDGEILFKRAERKKRQQCSS